MLHIINPFWNPYGGSEQRALQLFHELRDSRYDARLWAGHWEPVDPSLAAAQPIRRIRPYALSFPVRGTCIFVGMYFGYGRWLMVGRPKRIVVVCNIINRGYLDARIAELTALGMYGRTEFVHASALVRDWSGVDGPVEVSPIDLTRFFPRPLLDDAPGTAAPFTVGRLSRDTPEKHHPDDVSFYAWCLAAGMRVRLMGATCLQDRLPAHPRLDLLPAGAVAPEAFLRSLDCFYYRTAPEWTEPHGRVITEAMATGLPVVAHRRGGYTDIVEDGKTGYLFDTTAEAQAAVGALQRDVPLRTSLGRAARAAAEDWFSPTTRTRWLDYYAA